MTKSSKVTLGRVVRSEDPALATYHQKCWFLFYLFRFSPTF